MVKILVIENKKDSALELCTCLKSNGFSVETVAVGEMTTAQLRCVSCAMILCDQTAMENREIKVFMQNQNAPILWIAEQKDLPKAVRNFRMGKEDYVVKPVSTAELLARINMLMRCAGIDTGRKLHIGSLFMDADSRISVVDGREISLTMREFDILFGLLSEPERVFTRKELMQAYWGEGSTTNPRAVDVYITKIRDKFSACDDFRIVTVHGVGYKAVLKQALRKT